MSRVKYPRTFHLPFSQGGTSDDKLIQSLEFFKSREIVITEKMDGENTTMYSDYIHARSIDSKHHVSRDWVKAFHAQIAQDIPANMRICGENLYAKHSLKYDNLRSYFYGFSVWEGDTCLDWDTTQVWFEVLGIQSVPILYRGKFDLDFIQGLSKSIDTAKTEGFVMRVVEQFQRNEFEQAVAKWVRKGHVQTNAHWAHNEVIPNLLNL